MRVEEVVGWQMHLRRDAEGLTQAQLGERIGTVLGKPWSRQAVSAAEKGDRAFGAADLLAIAVALRTTVSDLLRPPVQDTEVELGDGTTLPRDVLEAGLFSDARASAEAFQDVLGQLARSVLHTGRDFDRLMDYVRLLDDMAHGDKAAAERRPVSQQQPVVAAIVTAPEGVLISRRNDRKPPWGFISGEVEPGERPEDAAVREVKEETSCEVRAGRVIGSRVHPMTGRDMIYMAAQPTGATKLIVGDEAELAEVRWASRAEALELMPDMFGPVREYLTRELRTGS